MIAPMRPDRYLKIAAAMRREGMGITSGFASAAQRCPDRPGLIDELGTLTWKQLDDRGNAFAAKALQALPSGPPKVAGIMCRNHRGFVEALMAANRIGADILLLNTSFAGPALADVVTREDVDTVIYDEDFTATVDARWPRNRTRPASWHGPTSRTNLPSKNSSPPTPDWGHHPLAGDNPNAPAARAG